LPWAFLSRDTINEPSIERAPCIGGWLQCAQSLFVRVLCAGSGKSVFCPTRPRLRRLQIQMGAPLRNSSWRLGLRGPCLQGHGQTSRPGGEQLLARSARQRSLTSSLCTGSTMLPDASAQCRRVRHDGHTPAIWAFRKGFLPATGCPDLQGHRHRALATRQLPSGRLSDRRRSWISAPPSPLQRR
jgi:hypothetical protein